MARTRALAFGPEEHFVQSLGIHTVFFSLPNHPGLDHTGQLYVSPGKAANMFAGDAGGRARAALHFAAEELAYDRHGTGEQQRIVAERFTGEGWEIPRLLAQMRKSEDVWFDANVQVLMDTWSSGRVALLGDVGYCAARTSGRGTSQALNGAHVLDVDGELAQARGDHRAGFMAYERAIRPFATEHQAVDARARSGSSCPRPPRRYWTCSP
ncbi:hypothetical protein [Streptomyces sp. NPDC001851]|uniref:hypothetical protein n=1 Tax=Streptomyces sp. NPDC001851 TaxID=3154529 RepID=UPI003318750E